MDPLSSMWETVPPATPDDLAGARRRLLEGMRTRRRRVVTVPRLLVVAGVVTAAVVTPLIAGTGTSAYAVIERPDGTIAVTVNELRDPEGLAAELAAVGVKADITFLEPRTRCAVPRFESVDGAYGGPPLSKEELMRETRRWRSVKATRPISVREIGILPEHIGPDETLVLEFRDNQNADVPWTMGAWLARSGTPVHPCDRVPA
ncbi:hypothetical protein [Nonomuraea sp. NPDC050643]|uniref:hypothetical protein n=1 Tax=Nonomuraea sp. NPDC050643 TaxID=3155660 RepID=UPI0033E5E893